MVSRAMLLGKSNGLFPLSISCHLSSRIPRLTNIDYRRRSVGAACKVPAVQNGTASVKRLLEKDQPQKPENSNVKMLYDGECPLCMREVNMLRERNKNYNSIKFVDISSKEYSAKENQGLDYATVMGRIHVISNDGTVLTNVAAFRRLYEEVGLGWVYAITKYEPIASIVGAVYALWAKYRLQITGETFL